MSGPSTSLYERVLAAQAEPPPARPPRASAAVVPWRRRGDRLEVFWVRRSEAVPFMPGWHAFPGGAVAKSDAQLHVRGEVHGALAGAPTSEIPAGSRLESDAVGADLQPGIAAAALRELWEETGVLCAALDAQKRARSGDAGVVSALREDERIAAAAATLPRDLAADALDAALGERGLQLDASGLVWAGRWLTPPFAPLRFDNRFFLLHWPTERVQQPAAVPGELAEGEWIEPALALARWRSGDALAAPPILHILTVLAEDGPENGLVRLRQPLEADLGPFRRIEFRPGVVMIPLRTPTLPPATHTNAYLLGTGPVVLVDPGSPWPAEQEKLHAAVTAAAERLGRRLAAVWLTHHHPDHVGGAAAIARAFDVPVLAHEATAARLAGSGIEIGGLLAPGERHELGAGFHVRVHHTPGHARGHLCFEVEGDGALLCGDLLSALSTIVIDPPEGDMGEYLESLARMGALAPRFLFPAHGPVLRPGERVLARLAAHRREREQRVLAAWNDGLRDPLAMIERVYAGDNVPAALYPVAARQVEAHLEHLRAQRAL